VWWHRKRGRWRVLTMIQDGWSIRHARLEHSWAGHLGVCMCGGGLEEVGKNLEVGRVGDRPGGNPGAKRQFLESTPIPTSKR